MLEAEMEKLLTIFPNELIAPGISLHSQQEVFPAGRTDLIFHDNDGKLLVVEVKAGVLSRENVGQICEYWPQVKDRYSDSEIRLMVIAPDIPYERRAYLEQFKIEFREISLDVFHEFMEKSTGKRAPVVTTQKEGAMPKPRKANYNSATYKILNTVSRGLTTLSLKLRKDVELPYNCLVWREKRIETKSNRRFYLENNSFWQIPASTAYEMLDEAHARGLFSSRYYRWPDRHFTIIDSKNLSESKKKLLINETLSRKSEDETWRECNSIRIVAVVEPWEKEIWRKVMVLCPNENIVTFRSLTRSETYSLKFKEGLFNGWQLDRSMMDADGFIHKAHLEVLKEYFD